MSNQKRSTDKGFAFVVADPFGKPNSDDRRLIRSHVMRGKNTRAARTNLKSSASLPSQSSSHLPTATPWSVRRVLVRNDADSEELAENANSLLPRVSRTPNDMYMFQLADDVDSTSRAMLFEFYAVIKEAMYPVEWCLHWDNSKMPWFYWLCSDAAYLHSILFTVGLLRDAARGSPRSKKTNFHIWKTVSLLKENIADQSLATSDSTIATILAMCFVAEIVGDYAGAAAHVAGLRQIVGLRGGVQNFRHNTQLQVKICRVDIGWYLCTGEKPLYYKDDLSWEPAFASILGPSPAGLGGRDGPCRVRRTLDVMDPRMGSVFQDLQDFSRLTKLLFRTERKIDPCLFQDLMTSIQYRIMHLELPAENGLAEGFRLGMIGYLTTLFLLISGKRLRFDFFNSKFRSTCRHLETAEPPGASSGLIQAWILVIGAISIFDPEDDVWLMPKLADIRGSLGNTWPEAKRRLEEVMWIEAIHDLAGIKVFEKLVFYDAKIPPEQALINLREGGYVGTHRKALVQR
ncbi:hypothetical protein CCHL11_08585 [Colletotrichum chlorophyti]|uniref:Transcription factor domain-containing protein n=1 Tax=Colletotrichum chlorophyti TaxID=708187 RepID=A0A1Q8RAH1_9PEZI|nr:hypothetical protein CCHL11_08585 [Colletotrichum chlorophyti]